jgi:hypothetical protein
VTQLPATDGQHNALVDELFESLNGFDEIAICKHFGGHDVSDLKSRPMTLLRALIFVEKRREGMKDLAAKEAALSLTMREVSDRFEDEGEQLDAAARAEGNGE